MRYHRSCDLAPPTKELSKTLQELRQLDEEILETKRKELYLYKQQKLLRKRARDLGDHEAQNILELKAEEALADSAAESEAILVPLSPGIAEWLAEQFPTLSPPAVVGGTSQSPYHN